MGGRVDESLAEIGREIALLHEHSYGDSVAAPEVCIADGFVTVLIDVELWKLGCSRDGTQAQPD